jgi:LPXTG-site transpeptidase (sortase) family protein
MLPSSIDVIKTVMIGGRGEKKPQKKQSRSYTRSAIVALCAFVLVFGLSSAGYIFFGPEQPEAKPQSASISPPVSQVQAQANEQLPARLIIPALEVNTVVEQIDITPDGLMAVPADTDQVGWLGVGTKPGEVGSAVMTGHLTGENEVKGVFANLNRLRAGDELLIEKYGGEVVTFVVQESKTYDPGYAEEVFSRNDGTYLNLITCDGLWDEDEESYSKRLVVFAEIKQ